MTSGQGHETALGSDRALRVFVYDWVLTHGLPPTTTQVAAHFRTDASAARRVLAELKIGKTVLVHPESGEIWMAGPFAAAPTPYRILGSHTSWYANCAWDWLGVAVLANAPVRLEATCTDCGASMTMHAAPGEGPRDEAVVHFLVPARHWYDDIGFT